MKIHFLFETLGLSRINFFETWNLARMTPYHTTFFDDILVDIIVGYMKLYSHKEKTDISFGITNEKIGLFLSMLLPNGWHNLPDRKMYWETPPENFV